jgi:hypothetical protein
MKLLHNCWGTLSELADTPKRLPDPLSREEIRSDLSYFSLNPFSVLETVEGEYPPEEPHYSKVHPRNKFLASTMSQLGGGEESLKQKLSDTIRTGGGIDDGWRVLRSLDHHWPEHDPYTLSNDIVGKRLGLEKGGLKPLNHQEAAQMVSQNLSANPGPTYKALGFKKKRDSIALAMDIAREVERRARWDPFPASFQNMEWPAGQSAGSARLSRRKPFLIVLLGGWFLWPTNTRP